MSRILVTGGLGFIGTHLCQRLQRLGHQVSVLDWSLVTGPHFDSELLIRIDIQDEERIRSFLGRSEPEIVFHLAAVSTIPACVAAPLEAIRTNILGTHYLLKYLPIGCRFIFSSSAAVYSSKLPYCDEDSTCDPEDIYGSTKLAAEKLLDCYPQGPRIIARLFNVVGPGDANDHVLPSLLKQVAKGSSRVALGNINTVRDYVHVDDVCRCLEEMAFREIEGGHAVFNVGTGIGASARDLIAVIEEVTRQTVEFHVDESRIRRIDRLSLIANTSRFQEAFGWKPEISLEQSVADAWRALSN